MKIKGWTEDCNGGGTGFNEWDIDRIDPMCKPKP